VAAAAAAGEDMAAAAAAAVVGGLECKSGGSCCREEAVTGCPNGVWWSCSAAYVLMFPSAASNLKFSVSCILKNPMSITICMEKLHQLIASRSCLSPIRIVVGNNLLHGEEVRHKEGGGGGLAAAYPAALRTRCPSPSAWKSYINS
jgi:hypothetical protein